MGGPGMGAGGMNKGSMGGGMMNKGRMGAGAMGGIGSSSLGEFGGGMGAGLDGFGTGTSSAAQNVQNALSSLSQNAVSPRLSRYGQSVQAGSSPSAFDISRSDRSSLWGNPYYNQSIRDAGEKAGPASVLGSIAASSQRRMKEIERLVYFEEEGRPMPHRGATIGDFDSGYGMRRRPLQRSSGRRPQSADPYSMDRFDNDFDDDRMYRSNGDYDVYGRDDINAPRGGRRTSIPPNGLRRMDRFDNGYDVNDGDMMYQSGDNYGVYDNAPRQGKRKPYPSNGSRRVDQFDSDYDAYYDRMDDQLDYDGVYDDDRYAPRGGRPTRTFGKARRTISSGRMDQVDRDYDLYDDDDMRGRRPRRRRMKPPRGGLRRVSGGRRDRPDFDPMYDDPYVEPR